MGCEEGPGLQVVVVEEVVVLGGHLSEKTGGEHGRENK